jgi:hypothetical protein
MSESSGPDNRRGDGPSMSASFKKEENRGIILPSKKNNTHNSRSASDVLENFP